jgi:hypothetical protein
MAFNFEVAFDVADRVSWVSVVVFDTGASWEGAHAAILTQIAATIPNFIMVLRKKLNVPLRRTSGFCTVLRR